jgi:hypothetical protein
MRKARRKAASQRARSPRISILKRRKVTKFRARDFPIPRLISGSRFEEICRPYGLSEPERTHLLDEINVILKDIGRWMRVNPHVPISKRRDVLRSAEVHIKEARDLIKKRSVGSELGFAAEILASLVSTSWL